MGYLEELKSLNQGKRFCQSYLRFIKIQNTNVDISLLDNPGFNSFFNYTSDIIKTFRMSEKERIDFVVRMRSYANDLIIEDSYFEWVKNDYAIYFLWMYFFLNPLGSTTNAVFCPAEYGKLYIDNKAYQHLNYNSPSNNTERLNAVISHIDSLHLSKNQKCSAIYMAKEAWGKQNSLISKMKFLDIKNQEQSIWLWEYITNFINNKPQVIYFESVKPFDSRDKHFLAVGILLAHSFNKPAVAELAIMSATKAWNQKKYRDSVKNKKALNTYISTTAKDKLDKLASANNVKINEMLEKLINDEYSLMVMK
ncbi:hypothetical protein [Buttiauxella izardii]|uniref:Uncharacterized protein n=1 Tax=Buttiauxella izardii TaxID=82991 RepID=A0A3A5JNC9_9ENTR|nr:hypothetical protein [Buttiauxella izardii]RJT19514.1 hypothetical protein D6029_18550 [Buttiauxella izardii]